MLIDELNNGCWILELDGDAEAALRLTFEDGRLFEDGVEAGSYGADGRLVRARIGESVEVTIEEAGDDAKPFTMMTQRHGDGADLLEFGRLVRESNSATGNDRDWAHC